MAPRRRRRRSASAKPASRPVVARTTRNPRAPRYARPRRPAGSGRTSAVLVVSELIGKRAMSQVSPPGTPWCQRKPRRGASGYFRARDRRVAPRPLMFRTTTSRETSFVGAMRKPPPRRRDAACRPAAVLRVARTPCRPKPPRPRSSTSATSPRITAGRGPRPVSRGRKSGRSQGSARGPVPPPRDASPPLWRCSRACPDAPKPHPTALARGSAPAAASPAAHSAPAARALPQALLRHLPDHARPIRLPHAQHPFPRHQKHPSESDKRGHCGFAFTGLKMTLQPTARPLIVAIRQHLWSFGA